MMKRILCLIALFVVGLGSCKSDSKSSTTQRSNVQTESNSNHTTMTGEFIYADSVAVFKKNNGIFGVVMNTQAANLINKARELDPDPYAAFDVTLKVIVEKNQEKDAWPEVIDIQTIEKVKRSSQDDALKLDK